MMTIKQIQLCTSFYDFKDRIDPTILRINPIQYGGNSGMRITINEDNILITTHHVNTSYEIKFGKNEVSINMSSFYYSHDDDIAARGKATLILNNNLIEHNERHHLRQDLHNHIDTRNDDPLSDKEINDVLKDVVLIIGEYIPISVLEAAYLKKQKVESFETYFSLKQAFQTATQNSESDKTNKGLELMTHGNVLATLFSSQIAPLAGIEAIPKDDLVQYDNLSNNFSKKNVFFNQNPGSEEKKPQSSQGSCVLSQEPQYRV